MNKDQFGQYLKLLNWSQAEFARKVDVAPQTVSRWNRSESPYPKWLEDFFVKAAEAKSIEQIDEAVKIAIAAQKIGQDDDEEEYEWSPEEETAYRLELLRQFRESKKS